MFKLLNYPDDATGTGITPGEKLSKQDIIDVIDKEDREIIPLDDKKEEEKEEKVEEEEEKEDEVKTDELDELEEELEEVDEEKLELIDRPRRRDILKEFPELFKKFPGLQNSYYREQQFTELLPTIEDAKEAVAKADTLDKFEADLAIGNTQIVLQAIKNSGDDAFNTMVDNFLPNLAKVDKDAYLHIVGNIISNTALHMLNAGKESNDEDLQAAAAILNKFVFQTNKFQTPTQLSKSRPAEDTAKKEIEKERMQLVEQKYNDARESLQTRVSNAIKNTIIENIDPKKSMTDYIRETATEKCQRHLEQLLDNDKRLVSLIDKLWEQAFKENFSKSSIDKIRTAYTSKAKTLMPTVIQKARNEALKGIGKRVREEDDTPKKGPVAIGKTAASRGISSQDKGEKIPAGVSPREWFISRGQ